MFKGPSRPIEHVSRYGTIFKSRADLKEPIVVQLPGDTDLKKYMADCVEFGAWHQREIHPTLNGFSGYDCISFYLL